MGAQALSQHPEQVAGPSGQSTRKPGGAANHSPPPGSWRQWSTRTASPGKANFLPDPGDNPSHSLPALRTREKQSPGLCIPRPPPPRPGCCPAEPCGHIHPGMVTPGLHGEQNTLKQTKGCRPCSTAGSNFILQAAPGLTCALSTKYTQAHTPRLWSEHVPQRSHGEPLNFQGDGVKRGGLWEALRSGGWSPGQQHCVLGRGPLRPFVLLAVCEPRGGLAHHASAPTSCFQSAPP